MICATPSPSTVCWHGIGRGLILRPNSHCSRLIWDTAPSPALKFIYKPQRKQRQSGLSKNRRVAAAADTFSSAAPLRTTEAHNAGFMELTLANLNDPALQINILQRQIQNFTDAKTGCLEQPDQV
jgi:hypothetical protein